MSSDDPQDGVKRSTKASSSSTDSKSSTQTDVKTFKKRPGTTDKGREYENAMVAHLCVTLTADPGIQDFEISSNDTDYGDFDDVVVQTTGSKVEKLAVQLKHIADKRSRLKIAALASEKGDFSINKYYKSFQKAKIGLKDFKMVLLTNQKSKLENEMTIRLWDKSEVKIVKENLPFLPNTNDNDGMCYKFELTKSPTVIRYHYLSTIDENVLIIISNVEDEETIKKYLTCYSKDNTAFHNEGCKCAGTLPKMLLYTKEFSHEDFDSICDENVNLQEVHHFTMKEDYLMWIQSKGSVDDVQKDFATFLEHFFLLTNQCNVDDLNRHVKKRVEETGNIFDKYSNFIRKWSLQEGNRVDKLTKPMMKTVVALHLFDSCIEPLTFGHDVTKNAKLLRDAISKFNLTIFDQEVADDIKGLWGDIQDEPEHMRQIGLLRKMYQISDTDIYSIDKLNKVERSKYLWLMDKCPLIVRNDRTDVDVNHQAIKLCQKPIVILNFKQNNALPTDYKNLIFQKLSDLQNYEQLYQELLDNFRCYLDESSIISLSTLLKENQNLSESISTNQLVRMLKVPYKVETNQEQLSVPYIYRDISRNIVKMNYLTSVRTNTFIIISNITNQEEIKKYLTCYSIDSATFHNNKECKCSRTSPNILLYTQEFLHEDFYRKCNEIEDLQDVHHFRMEEDHLVWIKSKGPIEDVQKYRLAEDFKSESEFQLYSEKIRNNVFLITDEPGKGKSMLLKHIKNQLRSRFFTIFFTSSDLNKLCTQLESSNQLVKDFETFVLKEKCDDNKSIMDKRLINFLLREGKIIFFWDALDEISNKNFHTIEKLLKNIILKPNFVNFITCRNHLKGVLESSLSVLATSMELFNEEKQSDYINKRLKDVFEGEDINKVTRDIKRYIDSVKLNDILGIPIQIFMLTEVLRQNKEKYFPLLDKAFSVTKLYDYFVNEKLKMSYKIEGEIQEIFLLEVKKRIKEYEKAALASVLGVKFLKNLKLDCSEFLKEIEQDDDKFGFITHVEDGTKAHFAHQSYAEYFVASYFVKNSECIPNLSSTLFATENTNVRYFFDALLAGDSGAHLAVLNKNFHLLSKLDEESLTKTDEGGRTVVHLLSSWGERCDILEVEQKSDTYYIDGDGYNAARKESDGYIQAFDHVVEKCDLNVQDQIFKMTAKEFAEKSQRFSAFASIIRKQKTDLLQIDDPLCCNALYYSVLFGNASACGYLAKQHYLVAKSNNSMLKCALNNRQESCFKQLLDIERYKKELNTKKFLDELLFEAAEKDCPDILKLLIDFNADINSVHGHMRQTPIHISAEKGYEKIVKLLIEANAALNVCNGDELTALHLAAKNGHEKVVQLLIEAKADLNATNKNGYTALHLAAENGHQAVVRFLIDAEADLNACDKNGQTALHLAVINKHEEVVKLLIQAKSNLNVRDQQRKTALALAAARGFQKIIMLLIEGEADLNAHDKDGLTPLHWAVRNRHKEVVIKLIEAKADLNIVNKWAQTAFHLATGSGHKEIVRLLIQANADLKAVDGNGDIALHLAAMKGHEEIVLMLIDAAGGINTVAENDKKLLLCAIEGGLDSIVCMLGDAGVGVNFVDEKNRTPLHTVVGAYTQHQKERYARIVRSLLKYGANIHAEDRNRQTALDLAKTKYANSIVDLLLERR